MSTARISVHDAMSTQPSSFNGTEFRTSPWSNCGISVQARSSRPCLSAPRLCLTKCTITSLSFPQCTLTWTKLFVPNLWLSHHYLLLCIIQPSSTPASPMQDYGSLNPISEAIGTRQRTTQDVDQTHRWCFIQTHCHRYIKPGTKPHAQQHNLATPVLLVSWYDHGAHQTETLSWYSSVGLI